MKIEITNKVNHTKNQGYYCMLVQFDSGDSNFFANKKNWMPKDIEVYTMFKV